MTALKCLSDSRVRMRASASPRNANTSRAAAETTTAPQPQPGARRRIRHTPSRPEPRLDWKRTHYYFFTIFNFLQPKCFIIAVGYYSFRSVKIIYLLPLWSGLGASRHHQGYLQLFKTSSSVFSVTDELIMTSKTAKSFLALHNNCGLHITTSNYSKELHRGSSDAIITRLICMQVQREPDWLTHSLLVVWLALGWTRTSWSPQPSPRAPLPAQRQGCRTHSGGK